MKYGHMDESSGYFAQKYFEKAQEIWIMTWLTLDSTANFENLATRWEVGILLFNAWNEDMQNGSGMTNNNSGWTNTGTDNNSDMTSENTVNIENFAFVPAVLTVKAGTKVTWKQKDYTMHQPISTNVFTSTALNLGDTFSFTFTTTGEFDYYCMIHPFMTGKIMVQ